MWCLLSLKVHNQAFKYLCREGIDIAFSVRALAISPLVGHVLAVFLHD